jgi:hypothetical protein
MLSLEKYSTDTLICKSWALHVGKSARVHRICWEFIVQPNEVSYEDEKKKAERKDVF